MIAPNHNNTEGGMVFIFEHSFEDTRREMFMLVDSSFAFWLTDDDFVDKSKLRPIDD